ncbi:MAG TPA: 16S rRNA (uracil(1498)-N(3))-methyltransferase [Rubrivivax sp.]
MPLRLFVDAPLASGTALALPGGAARHAQVRRVQPGDALQLFDGHGGEWAAVVTGMTRQSVDVRIGEKVAVDSELPLRVTLALGVPTNERMDTLVEKATELGVAVLQPLLCERSVLRLDGERAERKRAHWQAIAVAACEQCGRATVPVVEPVRGYAGWLAQRSTSGVRLLLSLDPGAPPLHALATGAGAVLTLSGPEGGLTPGEERLALAAGFAPVALGPRVLRADTAPLAVLAWLGLRA